MRKDGSSIAVVLNEESFFKGKLIFQHSLKIDGRFEGLIETPGFLVIGDGADVKAEIKAGTLIVGGKVEGDIEALDTVELLPTAHVTGNIKAKKAIKLGEGAIFEGRVDMIKIPGIIDIFSTSLPQLKKSLRDVGSGK